jgi:predicted nucleic acid-binding protein
MSLFVDTSIWYAAADSSDTSNARAKSILSAGEPLVTTDHVLVETWTLLRFRIRRQAAERFWEGVRNGAAALEPVGMADLEVAWQIGFSCRDQDFSIVLSSDLAPTAAGLLRFCDEIAMLSDIPAECPRRMW